MDANVKNIRVFWYRRRNITNTICQVSR